MLFYYVESGKRQTAVYVKVWWSWHQVCCVCGSLLLLPAEEKSDPGRCSLLWINILQVVYFEEMTSRQNQKRGGREREKERKGASKSREFILTAFDSSSHKEWGEQAPVPGADTSVGERRLLDKSHYSLLPFTTGRLYQKKGAAVVIPFRAKKAYSETRAEKILRGTGEARPSLPWITTGEEVPERWFYLLFQSLPLLWALGRSLGESLKSVPDLPSGTEK